MCKDMALMFVLNSCMVGQDRSQLTEGIMSHLPQAKSSEDSQAIMVFWSVLGDKVIRKDKGNVHCFMLCLLCSKEEFAKFLSVQTVTCIMEASLASSDSTGSSPPA